MLYMNPKGGRGSIRSLRATSISDVHMAANIAMHPLACGQPGKNGMQRLNREMMF